MSGKVRVGTSTVAGLLSSLAGFAAAVAAYKTGDRSEQTLGIIAGGTVGLISLLSTQAGRFLQALKATPIKHESVHTERPVVNPVVHGPGAAIAYTPEELGTCVDSGGCDGCPAPEACEEFRQTHPGDCANKIAVPYHPDESPAEYTEAVDRDEVLKAYSDLHQKVVTGGRDYDGAQSEPEDEGPGDDPPPQAALYPLTDPREIPMDEGDDGKAGRR